MHKAVAEVDPEIARLIELEEKRQREKIRLIPSENYTSAAVLEACGTVLQNKYSEGYPGKRYYEGQQNIDPIEALAIARARSLFGVDHANVQPYSGSPANLAVYLAFCQPGDTIMGMGLPAGGDLDGQGGVPGAEGGAAQSDDRRHRGGAARGLDRRVQDLRAPDRGERAGAGGGAVVARLRPRVGRHRQPPHPGRLDQQRSA